MQLRFSPTSPYVRKAVVLIREKRMDDRVENVVTTVWDPEAEVRALNPLGKIPVLITDDGGILFDSPVICEYLDQTGGAPFLLPAPGPARWTALRRQALADGILDAAVSHRMERAMTDNEPSKNWLALQMSSVIKALDALEKEAPDLPRDADIGTIAIGCALGYLDFRFPEITWPDGRPGLAAWYKDFAERPSMRASRPVG